MYAKRNVSLQQFKGTGYTKPASACAFIGSIITQYQRWGCFSIATNDKIYKIPPPTSNGETTHRNQQAQQQLDKISIPLQPQQLSSNNKNITTGVFPATVPLSITSRPFGDCTVATQVTLLSRVETCGFPYLSVCPNPKP